MSFIRRPMVTFRNSVGSQVAFTSSNLCLPLDAVRSTLEALQDQEYVLGFATGRTFREAMYPLRCMGYAAILTKAHIATYDYIERAEAALRAPRRSDAAG